LGKFQFKILRLQPGFSEHFLNGFQKSVLPKLYCGNINSDRYRQQATIVPIFDGGTSRFEHPLANGNDEPAVLGYAYEAFRRNQTKFRMIPAQKSFETRDVAGT